jgi:hypothetical protein
MVPLEKPLTRWCADFLFSNFWTNGEKFITFRVETLSGNYLKTKCNFFHEELSSQGDFYWNTIEMGDLIGGLVFFCKQHRAH